MITITNLNSMSIRDALGQIESGNDDNALGSHGEVSRYQIMPLYWHCYALQDQVPTNPEHAWAVAKMILAQRIVQFRATHHREPTSREIYILWNAPAHVDKPSTTVAERAERFGNLMEAFDKAQGKC